MKTQHNITLLFYLITPAEDRHTNEQMRDLGESGIYEPVFANGDRKMLSMLSRFDIEDNEASMTAVIYAVQNVKKLYPDAALWGLETYIDGIQQSSTKYPA